MTERRSHFIVAACLISALSLSSCGPKPAGTNTEQRIPDTAGSATQAESTGPNRSGWPVIVTFGDSLTAGVAGKSYPEQLQDLLDEHGYKYRVDNQGVSGDTTTDGLARIDNVITEKPALVVLEFGGNDGLRGVPVGETRNNLEEMITRLKRTALPIVLLGITLPPNYGPDYVKEFTSMYPQLARENHLKYIPFLLLNVYQHPEMMQPDGIHPNGAGNHVVAQDVFNLIKPMLVAH